MSVTKDNICNGPGTVALKLSGDGSAVDIGALAPGGVTITREPEILLIHPEQTMGPIKGYPTSESYVIAFTIWELTTRNIDLMVFGGDGSYDAVTPDDFGGTDECTEAELTVYGTCPGGFQRAVVFNQTIPIEPGDWTISREAEHNVPAKWRSLCDPADNTIGAMTDSAS
ncbi:MAG: hypothetical protein OCU12_07020 [Methanophagales archaeon]|nr:hypothetical protein [Methanophagales archaeon]